LLATQVVDPPRAPLARRVRRVDATTLSHPASKGADWRLHASDDLARGVVDAVEGTDGRGGEHLGRVQLAAGDLVVADRRYAHEQRLSEGLHAGVDVLVRVGHRAVPLVGDSGAAVDPLAFAARTRPAAGRPPRAESRAVYLRADAPRARALRLVVVRKAVVATDCARERVRRESSRKGNVPTQRTWNACRFPFLPTRVVAREADDATTAHLYRLRWQLERRFERWKSLLGLARLRADDPDLAQATIYARRIAALVADRMTRPWRAFSPYGVPIGPGGVACLA
jgi:hypothetical protein